MHCIAHTHWRAGSRWRLETDAVGNSLDKWRYSILLPSTMQARLGTFVRCVVHSSTFPMKNVWFSHPPVPFLTIALGGKGWKMR